MRVLVTGWFSFDEVIATIGDELGADAVVGWLTELGIDHDVAWAPYLGRGPHWRDLDPADYTHLVFVSGPLMDMPLLRELTAAFAHAQRWAVNVSVVRDDARPLFHRVWARDAPGSTARPDLAIGTRTPDVPVVAVAFAPAQEEYGTRSQAEDDSYRRARGEEEPIMPFLRGNLLRPVFALLDLFPAQGLLLGVEALYQLPASGFPAPPYAYSAAHRRNPPLSRMPLPDQAHGPLHGL
jgi:hypothetical protein